MPTPKWLEAIFQAAFLVACLTACSLLGVPETNQANFPQALVNPTGETDITPLFVPISEATIGAANAASLAPSSAVIVPGASSFTWLSGDQGAALAGEKGVLVLSTGGTDTSTYSGTPEATQEISTPLPSLLVAAQAANVLAWASEGKTIYALDSGAGQREPSKSQSEAPVTGLTLNSSGEQLAYATFSSQVLIQKPGSDADVQTWDTPAWLANLSYSPDGNRLAGVDLANFKIYFLDINAGDVVRTLEWPDSATPSLSGAYLSPDWKRVAWVAQSAVQLMDANNGQAGPLLVHQEAVKAVAWSPDSRLLATSAAEEVNGQFKPVVVIWDVLLGERLNTLVQAAPVQSVAFSPDGRQLAVLDSNGSLQTWSVSR